MKSKKQLLRAWAELERIRDERDMAALFALEDPHDFAWLIGEVLWRESGAFDALDAPPSPKRTLWLCNMFWEMDEADGAISLFESPYAKYASQIVAAFREIGAPKYAGLIERMMALLPEELLSGEDTSFEQLTPEIWDKLDAIEHGLSAYPDGNLNLLIYRYAHAHAADFV